MCRVWHRGHICYSAGNHPNGSPSWTLPCSLQFQSSSPLLYFSPAFLSSSFGRSDITAMCVLKWNYHGSQSFRDLYSPTWEPSKDTLLGDFWMFVFRLPASILKQWQWVFKEILLAWQDGLANEGVCCSSLTGWVGSPDLKEERSKDAELSSALYLRTRYSHMCTW